MKTLYDRLLDLYDQYNNSGIWDEEKSILEKMLKLINKELPLQEGITIKVDEQLNPKELGFDTTFNRYKKAKNPKEILPYLAYSISLKYKKEYYVENTNSN